MNENKYISPEIAKKLWENGCRLRSEYYYQFDEKGKYIGMMFIDKPMSAKAILYPAYDILNDICCKYVKDFFGNGIKEVRILFKLQHGFKKEVEEDIWNNCLFNPKKKQKDKPVEILMPSLAPFLKVEFE